MQRQTLPSPTLLARVVALAQAVQHQHQAVQHQNQAAQHQHQAEWAQANLALRPCLALALALGPWLALALAALAMRLALHLALHLAQPERAVLLHLLWGSEAYALIPTL